MKCISASLGILGGKPRKTVPSDLGRPLGTVSNPSSSPEIDNQGLLSTVIEHIYHSCELYSFYSQLLTPV